MTHPNSLSHTVAASPHAALATVGPTGRALPTPGAFGPLLVDPTETPPDHSAEPPLVPDIPIVYARLRLIN